MSTRNFKGFATLQTAGDLLRKVRHDYQRLRSAPEDAYAAFDFFVSAYHMLDWLHPNDASARKAEEKGNLLLQVCSHIATSGARQRGLLLFILLFHEHEWGIVTTTKTAQSMHPVLPIK